MEQTLIPKNNLSPIRYPGGKQRFLESILLHLPKRSEVTGRFIEPFMGGGAVFFAYGPRKSLLSDRNSELMDLYRGIRADPDKVWQTFLEYPSTKRGYYRIRELCMDGWLLPERAARTLYLNRTCFKGMWRHNADGKFNVGYGGQSRRWVITKELLRSVARRLKKASLECSDFETVIDGALKGDFLFCDPPYRPGDREVRHSHYVHLRFSFEDHRRLAKALARASKRGVRWVLTTSLHPDVLALFSKAKIYPFAKSVGKRPGILTSALGEMLVTNFKE